MGPLLTRQMPGQVSQISLVRLGMNEIPTVHAYLGTVWGERVVTITKSRRDLLQELEFRFIRCSVFPRRAVGLFRSIGTAYHHNLQELHTADEHSYLGRWR